MNDELLKIFKAQAHYNVSNTRILKYSIKMYHKGLNEKKVVSAPEIDMLENKVSLQAQRWGEKWDKLEEKRKKEDEKKANIEEAARRTEECIHDIHQIENILIHTLSIDDTVDWESLKKNDQFLEEKPSQPYRSQYLKVRDVPEKDSSEYVPCFTILDKIFKSRKERKIQKSEQKYLKAMSIWQKEKELVERFNRNVDLEFKENIEKWKKRVSEWENRKAAFYSKQSIYNTKIDKMKDAYLNKDDKSVIEYCEMVLNNSQYPSSFPQNFELEYNPENGILIVEFELPPIDCFPKVKEVKYFASRNELKETLISDSASRKMFDEAIYMITLRTIHELFEADTADALEAISFNGWVTSINKATGKEVTNCIISIQVKKDEFIEIDLSRVDPKTCFRNLKGVASSKLSTLTPVRPIIQISKTDKRFVEGYDVVDEIDNSTNLAAMDWEDFEHLIRELFEKEFQVGGGEVKVTQASRDGGVDAVAFDPDPIRGGKIVIQAKRYTNVVGVSAVRDLYGTVVNEGATKGILVTTAYFGSDAYDFAKGKPLTLLNGSNLLHLLEKHGHHAKIDIKEAKRILAENEK